MAKQDAVLRQSLFWKDSEPSSLCSFFLNLIVTCRGLQHLSNTAIVLLAAIHHCSLSRHSHWSQDTGPGLLDIAMVEADILDYGYAEGFFEGVVSFCSFSWIITTFNGTPFITQIVNQHKLHLKIQKRKETYYILYSVRAFSNMPFSRALLYPSRLLFLRIGLNSIRLAATGAAVVVRDRGDGAGRSLSGRPWWLAANIRWASYGKGARGH